MTLSSKLAKLMLFSFGIFSVVFLGSHFFNGKAAQAKFPSTTSANQQPNSRAQRTTPHSPSDTFTVTTLVDGGAGSLRQALLDANALEGTDTITITVTGTINLESSLPNIGDNVTINGPGAHLLTVRRNIGGTYRIFTINSGVTVSLAGLTMTNGLHDNGGGILNNGTLTVSNCVITGNAAPDGGGGVFNRGTLTMTNCTISDNNAAILASGGLWNLSSSTPATATLTNCTISGNTAGSVNAAGGGIQNSADVANATVNLINCTIANNTATNNVDGSGLFSRNSGGGMANINVKNTIVAGNSPTQVRQDKGATVTSLGHNLVSDNTLIPTTGDLLNTNPLLATLSNYGGPTTTHALLPGSPAINAGNNTGAPATDQRGIARPQQTMVDIGAFESRGFTLAVTSGNNQSALLNTAFANPLVVTVSSANSEPVQGGRVTFTPPGAGASATLTGNPATIQANGQASVTATANASAGAYQVTAAANGGASAANFNLTNTCSITITINPSNPTLPNGRAGTPYSQTFTQSGGAGTATFSVSAGSLPTGLSLASGGLLSGTPTVNGTFGFTIRATDQNNCTGERAYTLFLNPPCTAITVNPTTLPHAFQGTVYNQTLTATGGTGPYTFAVTAGSLPNGLTLASSGALTGTLTAAGLFNFTVTATDNITCTGTRAYTVVVSGNGLQFFPLAAPVRLLDTRPGASPNACSQPNAPITGQTSRIQPGRNFCMIPANAQALTGNVTTVNSGGGFLTLYPSDATQPTVASTNYSVNEIINNVFTVGLGADGAFKIFAHNTTDVVVDITGYYAPPAANGLYFHPLPAPVRLLETRAGQPVGCVQPGTPLIGGTDSLQTATTACTGIPAGARSVVGNATTVGPAGTGYLTLYPGDVPTAPLVASSNYHTGQVVNGPFTVGLSNAGQFKIFTTQTTDLVVDVLGYYSSEPNDANSVGLLFSPLPKPVRLLETRPGLPVGCFKPGVPLMGGVETTQTARGVCDGVTIPANALGVVGNATVVFPAGAGFLTLWPSTAARPLVATANYNAGDVGNRHFIVGLGQADGAFKLYTHATSHLVVDLSGYFAP